MKWYLLYPIEGSDEGLWDSPESNAFIRESLTKIKKNNQPWIEKLDGLSIGSCSSCLLTSGELKEAVDTGKGNSMPLGVYVH